MIYLSHPQFWTNYREGLDLYEFDEPLSPTLKKSLSLAAKEGGVDLTSICWGFVREDGVEFGLHIIAYSRDNEYFPSQDSCLVLTCEYVHQKELVSAMKKNKFKICQCLFWIELL